MVVDGGVVVVVVEVVVEVDTDSAPPVLQRLSQASKLSKLQNKSVFLILCDFFFTS